MEAWTFERHLDVAHKRGFLDLEIESKTETRKENLNKKEPKRVVLGKKYTVKQRGRFISKSSTRLGDVILFPGTEIYLVYANNPVGYYIIESIFPKNHPGHFTQRTFRSISDIEWEETLISERKTSKKKSK